MKHYSEIHIIKTTVNIMKQNKGLNGDLKSEHKKTTIRTTMIPTTDINNSSSSSSTTNNNNVFIF